MFLFVLICFCLFWINNSNTNKAWDDLSILQYVSMLRYVSVLDRPVWTKVCFVFFYLKKQEKTFCNQIVQILHMFSTPWHPNISSHVCLHVFVATVWLFPAVQWRSLQQCWSFHHLSLLVSAPRLAWSTGKLQGQTQVIMGRYCSVQH